MALTRRPAPPPAVVPPVEPGKRRPHLLYVEDEDANWEVALKRLQSRYDVRRARNSQEAFTQLANHDFDAVLMDIQLHNSDYDGIQITRILHKRSPVSVPEALASKNKAVPPIIFVTAYSARYTKEKLIAIGGADLITKPVDFVALTLTIARIIMRDALGPAQ